LGKKKLRSKTSSKGERRNVAGSFQYWSVLDRALFKAKAQAAGKRVCHTIANPDKSATNMPFIRVCSSGK